MGLAMWFRDDSKTSDSFSIADGVKVNDVLLEALLQGETITREKALMLPPVAGAVDFIANSVACMPVKLYKRKQGKVEEVEGDKRVKLLNGDTGDTLDAFQMKKAMVEDYLLGKGGYCYIERDRNDIIALRYVKEIYVFPIKNYHPIYKDYVINIEGGTYYPWEFIKLLRNTKDGAFGKGITSEISKTLETAYRTLLYQLNLVSTGGGKKGFLKSSRKLAQEEINTLKASWARMYSNSSENAVVLNNGVEFQEASNSSVENQINESKRTLTDEINDLFHISDNFEDTYKKAIYPIVKAFEVALNRDVLLEKEKKNHFFEFDIKEILRVTMKERYEAYKTAKETGFLTLNEIRRYENLNHIEGLDVVNVGLGAVLYDANTHEYYTPNTDTKSLASTENMLEGHVLAEEFDASGNSSAREERDNPNHDKLGRFTFGKSGAGSVSGGGSGSGDSNNGEHVPFPPPKYGKRNGYNDENFFMATEATFTPVEKPKGKPDYVSSSGSKYWYDKNGVVRESDHWGSNVDSCNWYMKGDKKYSSWDDTNGIRYGRATWNSFKPSYPQHMKVQLPDWNSDAPFENAKLVNVTPDMLKDGFVYYKGKKSAHKLGASSGIYTYIDDPDYVYRNAVEERHNDNHDELGRFTFSKNGGSSSGGNSPTGTFASHEKVIKKLSSKKYPDDTYDIKTLEPVEYKNGYQVSFRQIGDKYTDAEYDRKVNQFVKASSDGKTSAGKFGGAPEVSWHVKDRAVAEKLAKENNQISIYDWAADDCIVTGGTGKVE